MAGWRCGLTRTNRRTIAALIAASALLLALVSGDAQVSPSAAPPVAVEVHSESITAFDIRDASLRQFGLLEFRGGLVLRSSYQHFGDISAIRVAPDGAHFIALPPGLRSLPSNKGIEALVFVPKGLPLAGTLIAISERGLDKAGNIRGFLIGGASPGDFAVRRSSNYDVTDAALLPGGDVVLLERRFSWSSGLAVRMRRIPLGEIKPGAVVDGPVLFEVDLGYEIDNMEGLSVHRSAGGEVVLTLISDDNFSAVQRTLLLQFTLAEP